MLIKVGWFENFFYNFVYHLRMLSMHSSFRRLFVSFIFRICGEIQGEEYLNYDGDVEVN